MQFIVMRQNHGAMRLGHNITDAFGPFPTVDDAKEFIESLAVEGPYIILTLLEVGK